MKKYSFKDDYSEGAHSSILDLLLETNQEQLEAYGTDYYSIEAKKFIKKRINNPNADIHFVVGGTLVNLIVISALLRPHESVIAAHTGHIATHEAGAIEATGHKINSVLTKDGKLKPTDIQTVLDTHFQVPHMVKPKMVYISNTTELGTVYNLKELEDLYKFCQNNNLYLFLDGARLGVALTSEKSDLTLEKIAKLTDVFYIGGTKNGAIIGEAIVINNENLQADFSIHLKQKGALSSKGRLFGIQFFALFKDNLFFELAKHANLMADKLKKAIVKKEYPLLTDSSSNQIFPILPNTLIRELQQDYDFHVWETYDKKNSIIRLVTSWATEEAIIDEFIAKHF